MSAKRIIGHTVGTPISINKLKEEIDVKEAVDAAITEMKENGEIVGTPGADGSRWFSGTQVSIDGGFPVYMISGAKEGDYYLNTFTGDVYIAGSSVWEYEGNIKGANGVGISGASINANGQLVVSYTDGTSATLGKVVGTDGKDGADGYTPVKGVDYFDGEPGYTPVKGVDYFDGKDGVSPTVATSKSGKVTTVTITDKNGQKTATINDGVDGSSVTVSSVSESSTDGGTNVVTFSDGKKLNVKNGSKGGTGATGKDGSDGVGIKSVVQTTTSDADGGSNVVTVTKTDGTTSTFTVKNGSKGSTGAAGSNGKDGTSVTVKSVSESTADGGSNVVTFSDGKTLTVKNGSKGSTGATGARGADGSNGRDGADGYTPVKGKDYYTPEDKAEWSEYIASELAKRGQLAPEYADSIEDCTDTSKMYVLPDGFIYAWMLIETEVESGGYKNWLEYATETYNGTTVYGDDYNGDGKKDGYKKEVRLSSSGSVSAQDGMLATGFIPVSDGARIRTVGFDITGASMSPYVISYNSSGAKLAYKNLAGDNEVSNAYLKDFTLDSATYGTGIAFIRISASATGSTLPSIVTVNEEIKAGGTEIIITEGWASTGHAFVPADYEDRIVELEAEVAELKRQLERSKTAKLSVSEVFAPSPQLPADGSETADFNGDKDYITAEQIYAYIDALLNKYPRFITKEIMGKDASGTHDWCRYVCSRRAYDAWQKPNYPPMYAWVNGSTTIYSVSVSPRIGDTLYTTEYEGTAKGTVTAVSNANQSRTVDGVVYTRDKAKDVAPTLVYTETAYSPYFSSNYAGTKNGIYDSTKTKISTISSMGDGTVTGENGVSYTRYPLGDRNSKFKTIPAIVIGGNEHGTGGDPATPAMISARMAKDLCECKNMNNSFLNLLKNEYMVVFCPVVNPWGLHKDNKSYYNSNGVNLDRNFDTIGWGGDTKYPQGAYGGSENETQYFMNTLVASKAKIAMCNHSYGEGREWDNGVEKEAVSGGICSFMFGDYWDKYDDALLEIAEVMAANYNLVFKTNDASGIPALPDKWAKTRSYFAAIGIDGIALEMNSRDGFITDPTNEAQGRQFTARVMEAAYTQLLQVLYMLIAYGGDPA